jgi:hypothetical protein
MTREQWAELSDEEKRIKVAEHDGWRSHEHPGCGVFWYRGNIKGRVFDSATLAAVDLPDYLNDLNAIQAAVDEQGLSFQVKFYYCLLDVIGHHDHMEVEAANATAAQRAEAFVRAAEDRSDY